MPTDPLLPFDDEPEAPDPILARDEQARSFAVDPSRNVVLEASAGTGKTRVLVTRYLNLLRSGVDPANILAITFTRKAAAEMRERIVQELRAMGSRSAADAARWRDLRDRLGEIGISTIDAFCLSLLREFPLEADLDPGFQVADETEVPRLADQALDAALRAARRLARTDEDVALLLAGAGERKVRGGLAPLLDRRLVAASALRRFLDASPAPAPSAAFAHAVARLAALLDSGAGGFEVFLADGPVDHPGYALLEADLRAVAGARSGAAPSRSALNGLAAYFLTKKGDPRKRPAPCYLKEQCASPEAWKRHARTLEQLSPYVADVLGSLERDLNRAMARAVARLFRIVRRRYARALEVQAAVDFSDALARTLGLLRRMDEFSQSRYRLEARYHHVLVDEFQDTSRAQWRLVERLVEAWGQGQGLAHDAPLQPSIFVVGDRKQSIYAFRDADVRMLRRARKYVRGLRAGGDVRRSITRSFRAAPALLAFTNDLFASVDKATGRPDAFRYAAADRFPVHLSGAAPAVSEPLGLAAGISGAQVAAAVAAEIERLLATAEVRDRQSGLSRPARPGDVAILFRSRESHRDFESALEERRIPTYVYKGLGFFDADEVKDLLALLRFLAEPSSDARAAAFLRSRFVRLSDIALRRLAPCFATSLASGTGRRDDGLPPEDAMVLGTVRASLPGWLARADRVPPAELLDHVLEQCAYAFELRGPREVQARENVKKVRGLLRRIQNRGYATLPRVVRHLERLSAGDESNAVIDAADSVNLMTVHAAKGLEFPIVFLVNLGRGTGTHTDPILVVGDPRRREPLVSIDGGLPEAEEAVRERDVEETKRLLYVAITRARERLYLSAVVKDERFKPGRGSLAEVLPASLRDLFAQAASEEGTGPIEWRAPGAGSHRFRVCPEAPEMTRAAVHRDEGTEGTRACDFAPWRDQKGVQRVPVTVQAGAEAGHGSDRAPSASGVRDERRHVGTLVHRLFQALAGNAGPAEEAEVAARASRLLTPEERVEVEEPEAIASEAASAFLAVRRRADVAAILDPAHCLYELPFSLAEPAPDGTNRGTTVIRGTIDCLARLPDGRVVVVEIKTGRPRHSHRAQLDWYVRAAREMFPGQAVEGLVLYA